MLRPPLCAGGRFLLWGVLQLKGFEIVKAVYLDPQPFDMERDLLTPTFKKKRPQLLKYYKVRWTFPCSCPKFCPARSSSRFS